MLSSPSRRSILLLCCLLGLTLGTAISCRAGSNKPATRYQQSFIDAGDRLIILKKKPQRVVSLIPTVTEILMRIGAGPSVVGITWHSILPPECNTKTVVGGFLSPDIDTIRRLQPDLIFYTRLQKEIPAQLADSGITLVEVALPNLAEGFTLTARLGRIFACREKARKIIAEEKKRLETIALKTARIPTKRRLRVMRIMGREQLMAPGDDSFQNDFIRAAGALPPKFGRNGSIIPITLKQWQKFNPQAIYGCGADRQLRQLLQQPGWREVDAVKNHRIYFFPCDFTCRAATHCGTFVGWLAARLYEKEFENPKNFVHPQRVTGSRPLKLGLDYLERADIVTSEIKDFENQTLVLSLKKPMRVISTLEGERKAVRFVANHYFPAPAWGLNHRDGLKGLRQTTLKVLGLKPAETAILFTGARMQNLAVSRKTFKEITVIALVTAGVISNAERMSADYGGFYEPEVATPVGHGTINILLLSNQHLSRRAQARALITATEAKSAALTDLDIRSSYTPQQNPATGTGTDNIIVVAGQGSYTLDNAGGHSKLGELIAKAVHDGVIAAIRKQNGLIAKRTIFQRLKERRIDLGDLCRQASGGDRQQARRLRARVEHLLLEPRYAGFLKAALALTDAQQRNLLPEKSGFPLWCQAVANEIAGRPIPLPATLENNQAIPPLLGQALNAILSGAAAN